MAFKIRDFSTWFIQIFLGKAISLFALSQLHLPARLAGNLLARPQGAGRRYQDKLRSFFPDLPTTFGRDYVRHFPLLFCERIKFPDFVEDVALDRFFDVEAKEHLDQALAQGKGAILLTSHFGAFEAGFLHLTRLGYKVNIVRAVTDQSSRLGSQSLHQAVMRFRMGILRRTPAQFLFYKPDKPLIEMIQAALDRNEIVLIMPEGSRGSHFYDVPLGRGQIRLASGFAYLSLKTGAPTLSYFCVREKNRYRLIIEPPLTQDNSAADLNSLVAQFANLLEKYIRRYPDQWQILPTLRQDEKSDLPLLLNPSLEQETFYDLDDFPEES
ncbi:MAG: hypothetical protein C0621_02315 [Desulfuromonas sp.]|nr:MAG: hypothetical protein C0621_02315 [Desulfuromonas sp.]